ncbi:hypothetical protein CDAR_122771 [Caerostris darwini]|uniref:Uncharacterized protein n=1 Tax=Caerostris darwini TaxID=1538125 RepID=A0AAV4UY97_9ARAC|nr:hypothetical protein CDAR_122771 [Caerostris darwini]
MKWPMGSSSIRVWLDTEIRTFKTSARDCRGFIVVGLFSPLKDDFFAGSVEDPQNGWLLNTAPSIKQASNLLCDCSQTALPSVLDEMRRGFFTDKSFAGHRDKDLQNVSQGLPWSHCCWAFLAAKRRFLRWLHGR